VLALPFQAASNPISGSNFVGKRLLRLYLPFLAALWLAVLCDYATSRHEIVWMNAWFNSSWNKAIAMRDVLSHSGLINHYDYSQYNKAFWSLAYEMQVSLAFPFLIWLNERVQPLYYFVGCILMILAGSHLGNLVSVIGMFMSGIFLSSNRQRLSTKYCALSRRRQFALQGLALCGYVYGSLLGHFIYDGAIPLILSIASSIVIIASVADGAWIRFLCHKFCQLMGHLSYSLYLVHLTVLYSLIYLTSFLYTPENSHLYFSAIFICYIGFSVAAAWVFFVVVERPCTRLARRLAWH
jgi:peptidoglycan/LPS O-acetylase OafA/YrhL